MSLVYRVSYVDSGTYVEIDFSEKRYAEVWIQSLKDSIEEAFVEETWVRL